MLKDKNLYYVGGCLRDEMLGISSLDIDYCYEGNAIEFAKNRFTVLKTNPSFGTVRIFDEDLGEVDIASTRMESYPRKGHLPQVYNIGCSLKEDLKRRDFTINAMARNSKNSDIVVDYFGGKKDIKDKLLRILHKDSFIDDPSRIVRGLKFSVRFGFELEEETKLLQDEYLNNINYDMSYHRLKKELMETFSLNKQKAFNIFVEQGIYKLLGPNQVKPKIDISIENLICGYKSKNIWIIYLSMFDLSNFELTRAEKKILDWAERLKTEKPTNNTPYESVIINKLRNMVQ